MPIARPADLMRDTTIGLQQQRGVRRTSVTLRALTRSDRASKRERSVSVGGAMQSINLARLDLVSIRLVVLCAELGSLSAAAKWAHCTLSAGSQRISALEEALGRRLFVRDHRGLRPTEAGQLVAQHGEVGVALWMQQAQRLGMGAHFDHVDGNHELARAREALALGLVTAETFERLVRPDEMV